MHRFFDSSIESITSVVIEGLPEEFMYALPRLLLHRLLPDIALVLDISASVSLLRRAVYSDFSH